MDYPRYFCAFLTAFAIIYTYNKQGSDMKIESTFIPKPIDGNAMLQAFRNQQQAYQEDQR